MTVESHIRLILQKDHLIRATDFKSHFPGGHYFGKVRDNYMSGNSRLIIATDRLSAFDRIITSIPFKGQLLNQATSFWFEKTRHAVPNHVISVPDPNVMIVKQCKVLPVEMIIRGYITGSAWRTYQKDPECAISGVRFPGNLVKNQVLDSPVITPTTKADLGAHDEDISREEILSGGIVAEEIYKAMEEYTYKLFEIGTDIARKNGLILVDTKYEFGIDESGQLVVIDEIHTPDSSRFWIAATYDELFSSGKDPDVLDKEFVRDWLRLEKNFMGDGPVPEVEDDVKVALCTRYIKNFEINTGQAFDTSLSSSEVHPLVRIKEKLHQLGYIT